MLAQMQSVTHRTTSVICIGGLITSLALAMNLHVELATLVSLPTPFLDKDVCHDMRMISNKQDVMYYLMVRNKTVKSIILPWSARIDVQNEHNWTFDLNFPKPGDNIDTRVNKVRETYDDYDDLDHGSPETSTHPHNAHGTSNTFAGTSFGHQPRGRDDYTNIRSSLDDVLAEMRQCNTLYATRDQMMHDIQAQ